MRAELANLNYCAVPFLSRAVANLCWYYTASKIKATTLGTTTIQQVLELRALFPGRQ